MPPAPSELTREHRLAALRFAGLETSEMCAPWVEGDGKPLRIPTGIDFDKLAAALAHPDIFLRDMAENLRARARGLEGEERFSLASDRDHLADTLDRIRAEIAKGVPFAQSGLYVEPR